MVRGFEEDGAPFAAVELVFLRCFLGRSTLLTREPMLGFMLVLGALVCVPMEQSYCVCGWVGARMQDRYY